MDIEDYCGLASPDHNVVDIEDSESDTNSHTSEQEDIVEKSENQSSEEKINFSAVLDNICNKYSADLVPSSWPFLVGNLVCFRPTKTSKWLDGKIEKKIPGVDGTEMQLLISSVNNPAVSHQIPYRKDLVKSNRHSADTLNNLDLHFLPRKSSRSFKTLEKDKFRKIQDKKKAAGQGVSVSAENPRKEDSPAISITKTGQKEKSSKELARVDDGSETGIAEEDSGGPVTLSEGKTLEERICEMFEENKEEFTGINFDDSKDLEDRMRSLSPDQVKTLVLSASSNLVKVVSSQSSFEVGIGIISHFTLSFNYVIFRQDFDEAVEAV